MTDLTISVGLASILDLFIVQVLISTITFLLIGFPKVWNNCQRILFVLPIKHHPKKFVLGSIVA